MRSHRGGQRHGPDPGAARCGLRNHIAAEVIELAGRLFRSDVSGLFSIYPAPDAGNPDRILLYIGQGGLGLPDESYYREEKFEPMVEAYGEIRAELLGLAGHGRRRRTPPQRVVALEKALASHHWDNVTLRDPQKTYNLKTAAEGRRTVPDLMDAWFDSARNHAGKARRTGGQHP